MYSGPKSAAGGMAVGGLAVAGNTVALWLACGLAAVIVGLLLVHATLRRIRARSAASRGDS